MDSGSEARTWSTSAGARPIRAPSRMAVECIGAAWHSQRVRGERRLEPGRSRR